ncbi:MAG TPA: aldo/keto reductase [Terriglobales bacterium]|jgi:aryl-alcohol dehydrogenase-like predicted oxidoreductase|nr:aldo/keto reductase [Terriglobales bacterium]
MQYRQLGHSGVRVSVIGLGTNRFGSEAVPQAEVRRIIDAALEAGVNLIDTANIYNRGASEETLGEALKGRRHRVVLATKFSRPQYDGPNSEGASRYHMMQAVEASLRRLQTDHIDLYYVHRWDETTPIEETLRGLDDLVRAGKILYAGASQFASWQLAYANLLAELRGWSPFVVIQSHYHMLERRVENEMLPYCQAQGVGLIPYFPLAGGFLTGKYKKGEPPPPGSRGKTSGYVQSYMTDDNFDKVAKLTAWANERGRGMNELAQAWLLAHAEICSVISGVTTTDHVARNVKAADWSLSAAEVQDLESLLKG